MRDLHGIVAALITPFDNRGQVDTESLARLVEALIAEGIDGFYACGSTGEAVMLSEEERKLCLETVIEANAGRKFVITHVGSVATDVTIRLAQHAESKGADAVSACAPFYYKFSPDQVMEHYLQVAGAIGIPFVCYNIPATTGFTLTVEMVEALHKANSRINAVKNTSSDMYHMERLKSKIPGLTVYSGYDEMCLSGLVMGADGAIGSTFNIMPKLFLRLRALVQAQKLDEALLVQRDINHMIDALLLCGAFPGVKAILRQKGLIKNGCKSPFTNTTAQQDAALWAAYEKHVLKYD